jgi:hypothetical protein
MLLCLVPEFVDCRRVGRYLLPCLLDQRQGKVGEHEGDNFYSAVILGRNEGNGPRLGRFTPNAPPRLPESTIQNQLYELRSLGSSNVMSVML